MFFACEHLIISYFTQRCKLSETNWYGMEKHGLEKDFRAYFASKEQDFRSKFDLLMSYLLESEIVAGYWSGKVSTYFRPPLPKVRTLRSLPH